MPPTTSGSATSATSGGSLHEPRRAGAQGSHAAGPGRHDLNRRRHLDAAAPGEFSASRRSSAGCSRCAKSRLRGRLRGDVPPQGGRPPLLQIYDVPVGRHRISTLTMDRGPTFCCSTASAGPGFDVRHAAELSRRYRVHAPDLPASAPRASLRSALQRALVRRNRARLMDELGSPRRTSSATRWAAVSRSRRPSDPLTGCGHSACCARLGLDQARPAPNRPHPETGVRTAPHQFRRSLVASQFWSTLYDADASIRPSAI